MLQLALGMQALCHSHRSNLTVIRALMWSVGLGEDTDFGVLVFPVVWRILCSKISQFFEMLDLDSTAVQVGGK